MFLILFKSEFRICFKEVCSSCHSNSIYVTDNKTQNIIIYIHYFYNCSCEEVTYHLRVVVPYFLPSEEDTIDT